MNGIEKITQQIAADTQAQVQETLSLAQAEAAGITASYQAQADALEKSLAEKGAQAAQQREARLASMAQMEARKLTLAAKQEMVSKAFDKALEDLLNLPDDQYVDLLVGLILKGVRTGREQVIFSAKDRSRFGKVAVTRANEALAKEAAPKLPEELAESKAGAMLEKVVQSATALLSGNAMLTLAEETRPMAGGLILRDEKVETNCSFEVLIHLQRDTLAAEVAKALF